MKYLACLFVLFPISVFTASYDGTVTRVIDGDTIVAQWNNQEERIRIIGIDTPEIVAKNRPIECFGQEASDYARTLLPVGDEITVVFNDQYDAYDRALAYITLADGRDFGSVMISDGYAYAFRSFEHERLDSYVSLESQARTNAQGLWGPDTCRTSPQSIEQTNLAWEQYIKQIKRIIEIISDIYSLVF